MVDIMPGETVEAAGAERVLPLQLAAPQHMNGCLTIPYIPSRHGGCHAPTGSCRSAGAAPGEEGIACNGAVNAQAPASCWGGFVSENFCVNGVVGGERVGVTLGEEGSTSLTELLLPAGGGGREPVEEEVPDDAGTCTTSLTTLTSSMYSVEATTESAAASGSLEDHLRRTTAGAAGGMVAESGRTFGEGVLSDEEEEEEEEATGMFGRQRPEEASSPAEAINLARTREGREEDTSSCGGSESASEEDSAPESDDSSSHPELDYMESPSYFDYQGACFNLKKSAVHVGPTTFYDFKDAMPAKLVPGVATQHSPEGGNQERAAPGLHISINTAPVQQPDLQPHNPLFQTYSAPVLSSKPPPTAAHRHAAQMPPVTPTSAGATSINNCSNVHVGTQIIINDHRYKDHQHPLESLTKPDTLLEKLLTEVREKLSTSYIRQTKTSFLPWLKGHQVIPMTEFYTESRILAVDKQGRPTHQQVNLVHDLVHEEETRFLVEGEPGMGKTLLAQKLAIDWANKNTLQEFKFVFLITLRDFKGSLEQYVKEELLPSHFEDKFKQVWEYCKKNEEQVLFILDGYDELEKADEGEILKLLRNRDFQNSKVVVTARPDVLKIIAQKMIVKGFSEVQMFEFISKYFKLVNEDECGRNLKRIIEKDCKYRKLAKRPLFCVLLCMLYGSDGVAKLPEKLSDMMFKIMLCLIKWNIKKVGNVDENMEDFPPKFKEIFLNFGKLCLEALMTEKTRFSAKKISGIENSDLLLHLGFLSNDSENDVLGHKMFWKPVHKIFLEYLAGLYMANHIERDKSNCKECREFSRVYRHEHVLKFLVGILGKRAHLALNGRRHQALLHMKDQELLMLLRETESTEENCQAVAKLLDRRNAIIHTSEVDFEGWSLILDQKFQKLRSLEIVWRIKSNNPDQESSFSEASPELYSAFFNALKSNISITKISIRATQDGEPFSKEKIELFFSHLQEILPKKNLQELEIKELKMRVSYHLRKAIEGATRHMDKMALEALKVLRLDIDMQDEDLEVLCDRLKCCAPNLKELQLTGLVHGPAGFKSLVELLKKNKNLHQLCISMNKAQLMATSGVFLSKAHFTPSDLHSSLVGMTHQANRNSKDAFKREKCDQKSQRGPTPQDPTQELKYLFQDHQQTGVKYSVRARNYYFIIGDGERRLPLPLCISRQHQSMFHRLFSALPESSVQSLTLDCPCFYLNTADLVCLGDAIRKAKNLTTLKLTDLKKAENYIPVLLGLGQSQSLTTVKLDSHSIVMKDTSFQLACTALRNNTTLRSLSLANWEFNLQDKSMATHYFKDLLNSWKVIDLNLSNCIIDVSAGISTARTLFPPILVPIHGPIERWSSIRMLRLSEVKLKEQLGFMRRAHLLLPILRNCPSLKNLDLSASHAQPVTLDDNAACKFFELLGTNFRKLRELTLANWEFKFDNYEKTCQEIGNMVRSCSELKVLKLDKVSEVRQRLSLPLPCCTTFLHQLVNNLPRLSELSLCYYRINDAELDHDTATHLGACFHNHWSSVTKFKVKFFGLSPEVEMAIREALKKENVDVVVSQDYPLTFTVKRGYFLRT